MLHKARSTVVSEANGSNFFSFFNWSVSVGVIATAMALRFGFVSVNVCVLFDTFFQLLQRTDSLVSLAL